jgi:hypothetical protein
MDYLSEGTRELINIVGEVSHTIEFELGPCMAKPSNGDMAWFMLTDSGPGIDNMFILICTPYGMLAEYNFDEVRHMSGVTDVGLLMEHLSNMGYRALTKPEQTRFFDEG